MKNLITIELCEEDRARLDRLAAIMERRATQAETFLKEEVVPTETPQNEPQAQEETTVKEEPTVTLEDIQQKVMELCTADKGKKKAKARDIVMAYSTTISGLKDFPEKWTEIWESLLALERES